jgi:glucose/arabinose dehydrogenase
VYVDGAAPVEILGVTCDSNSPSAGIFPCSGQLPALSPGAHTLELSAVVVDGTLVLASTKSPSFRVTVVTSLTTGSTAIVPPEGLPFTTADGVALRLDVVADALDNPTDIAFAPDGRIFIAEASGSILVADAGGRMSRSTSVIAESQNMGRLLAVTLDPRFADTPHVYTLWAGPAESRERLFAVARFTESGGALHDRVVLADDIPASTDPHGTLRFGPDGKLYAAFDDGDDSRRAGDLASRNGKVLRINPDGTTPADQENLTPVFAYGFRSPHAVDWQPGTGELWMADAANTGSSLLYVLRRVGSPRVRGMVSAAFTLPKPTTGSSIAFYRGPAIPAFQGNLLVASEEGQHVLRVRFDPADRTRIVATERLLQNQIGGVRVVAVSPGGTVYLGTASALFSITTPF